MSGLEESHTVAGVDRRKVIGGGLLLAAILGVPLYKIVGPTDAANVATDRQRSLIAEACQIVIPRTDTPGAGDLRVGDFVILALAHGLAGTGDTRPGGGPPTASSGLAGADFRGSKLDYLNWLEQTLDREAAGDWMASSAERRLEILTALDSAAFPAGPPQPQPSPWQPIKTLILTGYYTSEVGASQELSYELVPGRFDADIPLTPEMRAWSSDWTAVEFG